MKLGVLDQIPVRDGGTAAAAVAETFRLAEAADRWGYGRYWLAEHHNTGSLACPAPEILIPQVAARTSRIRIGSGGVMLTHYSPLKVAEVFRTIETLFPGRIDLGIGRAPGADTRTSRALAHGPGALGIEHFPEQLLDLYDFLADEFPPDHRYKGIHAMPPGAGMPELWLLGSANVSAHYAAQIGWGFSFAQFISPDGGEGVVRAYRDAFQPSPVLEEPRVSLGVFVVCADTEEEAERLSWTRWCWRIQANRGIQDRGIPSVEEALSYPYTDQEREYLDYLRGRSIHGTPGQVRDRLEQLAQAYGVDEFVIVTITYDFEPRLRSYELLAKEFELPGADAASETGTRGGLGGRPAAARD